MVKDQGSSGRLKTPEAWKKPKPLQRVSKISHIVIDIENGDARTYAQGQIVFSNEKLIENQYYEIVKKNVWKSRKTLKK